MQNNLTSEEIVSALRTYKKFLKDTDSSLPTIENLVSEIRRMKREWDEEKKKNWKLNLEINRLSKEVKDQTKIAKWDQLSENWKKNYPKYPSLPEKIQDALNAWKVLYRTKEGKEEVLRTYIQWANEGIVTSRELYYVVTLMSRVDFSLFHEFVPRLTSTVQMIDKFTTFRDFFEREQICYYNRRTEKYVVDQSKFRSEYRKK